MDHPQHNDPSSPRWVVWHHLGKNGLGTRRPCQRKPEHEHTVHQHMVCASNVDARAFQTKAGGGQLEKASLLDYAFHKHSSEKTRRCRSHGGCAYPRSVFALVKNLQRISRSWRGSLRQVIISLVCTAKSTRDASSHGNSQSTALHRFPRPDHIPPISSPYSTNPCPRTPPDHGSPSAYYEYTPYIDNGFIPSNSHQSTL